MSDNSLQSDYSMLVDLIKHHHKRLQHHTATFLAVETFLLAFIGWFFIQTDTAYMIPKAFGLLLLAVLGAVISVQWGRVICRIIIDVELRYFHLRYLEKAMEKPLGIFIEGYRFFYTSEQKSTTPDNQSLLFENCKGASYGNKSVAKTLSVIPLAFFCTYSAVVLLAVLQIFYLCFFSSRF